MKGEKGGRGLGKKIHVVQPGDYLRLAIREHQSKDGLLEEEMAQAEMAQLLCLQSAQCSN